MTEERIITIEERLAHQEHGLQSLSDGLYEQRRRIEHLAAQVRLLTDQVRGLSEVLKTAGAGDERPPHY